MEQKKKKLAEIWERVQLKAPLVHCITNAVTVNDCANILLAAGARPTMAHHPEEVKEVTRGCDALVCNFGATDDYDAMFLAAEEASRCGHPIVVDPVGAGGSAFRREKIKELFSKAKISCIRGNASEMRAVFEDTFTVTGVDAEEADKTDMGELTALAKEFSKTHDCVCVVSGKRDLITDGTQVIQIGNGHEWMARITGSGCMSTAVLGAFFATISGKEEPNPRILTAAAAVAAMGICGEQAAEICAEEQSGTMSFKMHMIDRMSMMRREILEQYSRLE